MKNNESGRSMVEMLGVLAIIGVLSIGGIAGYTMAMRRYHANNVIDAAAKLAVLGMTGDKNADLNDLGISGLKCGVALCPTHYENGTVNITGCSDENLFDVIGSISGQTCTKAACSITFGQATAAAAS